MSTPSTGLTQEQLETITTIEGNGQCADCGDPRPLWASISYGILVCLRCSGAHRSLGVHLSFVRSVNLDHWTESQYKCMIEGGNTKLNQFFQDKGVESTGQERYYTPAAALYRRRLKSLVNETGATLEEIEQDITETFQTETPTVVHPVTQPKWVPDSDAKECYLCGRNFTFLFRKHHCRKCGQIVCGLCSPADNTKPIIQFGYKSPVRHCKKCYRSPLVKWESLESSTSPFPVSFTLSLPKSTST